MVQTPANISTSLKCGHVAYFPGDTVPPLNDIVFCRKCANYSVVMGYDMLWGVSCLDCNFRRTQRLVVALPEKSNRDTAGRHANKMGHEVHILCGGKIQDKILPNGGGKLFGNDGGIFRDIAKELRKKIADGTYPVGSLLPSQDVYAQTHSVAHTTYVKACRILQEEGLIRVQRGIGMFVIAKPRRNIGYQEALKMLGGTVDGTEVPY